MTKLPRGELLVLVKKICNADFLTEEDYDHAIEQFLESVPDPEAARLISQRTPELPPEEIVDKALSYKPICL